MNISDPYQRLISASSIMSEEKTLSANEPLKEKSDFLRGTLAEEFADESTGAISKDNQQLSKFHGMYCRMIVIYGRSAGSKSLKRRIVF